MYTREDIKSLVKENNISFIRLQFTDLFGVIKNVEIPPSQLDKALDGELMFDGSSINGFVRIEESDMLLKPDFDTFAIFPWKRSHDGGRTARLICDIMNADGTPFEGCPRNMLKKVMKEAEEMGFTAYAGPEAEFYLFQFDENGNPTTKCNDHGGYFDLSPMDLGEDAREDIVLALQDMGFEVEASHHEVGPGQNEIDFKYADMVTTADNVATFKFVVKNIAAQRGFYATFMPKPVYGIAGNGMHLNQSLFDKNGNAFYDPTRDMGLSKICEYYIGGVLKHAKGFTAVTNPTVNSYKRLVSGFEAPVYIAWSERNRSPLIRIPSRRGVGTRVELRSPDPSCNPYLALAVSLKAGLDGIKNKINPPKPVNTNIYEMDIETRNALNIMSLPANLYDALIDLSNDDVIKEALGEHAYNYYMDAKLIEWDEYRTQVHDWELKRYFNLF